MFNRLHLLALCLLAFVAFPHLANAQDGSAPLKIAVVDVEKIINESSAGKSVQTQLAKSRESFQKEFTGRENKLMAAQKKLVQEKQDISPEEFSKKRKAFEQQLLETRNLFQKRRSSLDKGLGNALSNLRKNIIQVTAEVADEGKFQVVLSRSSVVVIQKEMDITQTVFKALKQEGFLISNLMLAVRGFDGLIQGFIKKQQPNH